MVHVLFANVTIYLILFELELHRATFAGDLCLVKDILRVINEPLFSKFIDINAAELTKGLTPLVCISLA